MRVYLDDLRQTPPGFNVRVYTYAEAVAVLSTGRVEFISFDHDLAAGPELESKCIGSGYDVACWIEAAAFRNEIPRLGYAIHSANPVGARRIQAAMYVAERYWVNRE